MLPLRATIRHAARWRQQFYSYNGERSKEAGA